jgi:hypothetical protein
LRTTLVPSLVYSGSGGGDYDDDGDDEEPFHDVGWFVVLVVTMVI